MWERKAPRKIRPSYCNISKDFTSSKIRRRRTGSNHPLEQTCRQCLYIRRSTLPQWRTENTGNTCLFCLHFRFDQRKLRRQSAQKCLQLLRTDLRQRSLERTHLDSENGRLQHNRRVFCDHPSSREPFFPSEG